MAEPNPTMQGHLAHGSWGMAVTTMVHDDGAGSFSIGICDVCHLLIAECNHEKNSWRTEPDGEGGEQQTLRCDLGGLDGR